MAAESAGNMAGSYMQTSQLIWRRYMKIFQQKYLFNLFDFANWIDANHRLGEIV